MTLKKKKNNNFVLHFHIYIPKDTLNNSRDSLTILGRHLISLTLGRYLLSIFAKVYVYGNKTEKNSILNSN